MAIINGSALAEFLAGTSSEDLISGLGGDDTLLGIGGNDTLDGGGGNDWLAGGSGNDLYLLNSEIDLVVEQASGGVADQIRASVTYTLPAHVEQLTLGGSAAIDGTGNLLANFIKGNSAANSLSGGAGNDTVQGLGGRDLLNGNGGADTLDGGGGSDVLIWDANDTSVDGGAQTDTLRVTGSGVTLDLTLLADTVIQNIETISITGSGNNTLNLSATDVLALSTSTNTLRVDGNAGDIVNAGSGWTDLGASGAYHQYSQSGATLLVDTDITQNIFP